MRAAALGLGLALAACSGGEAQAPQQARETVWCALGGTKQFKEDCTLERGLADGVQTFVVRYPDGGFHRLEASADGQQLLAADGADKTQSARKQDRWEVILGDARYVIPVKGPANANAPGH